MGALGQQYGFTGEAYATSEVVTVIDKTDAWVFEMTGDGKTGALWVAQRLPEDHVSVIANTVTIKEIDQNDKDNFMFSDNLFNVTKALGLWNGKFPFNWQKTVSEPLSLQRYASLRIWRVYSIASPSSNFAVNEDPNTYPFSVKVDKQFSIEDIMNLNRDHYEGTDFDMTKGILAGPFGNPNYEMAHGLPKGQGPRSISIMRTSYCEISTSGPDFPKVWFATDAPATSVFVPFYSAALQSGGQFSPAYGTQEGPDLHRFNRSTAFWAFDFVANWMGLNYQNMSQEMVYPARDKLQQWVFDQVAAGEKKAKESPENAGTILGQLQTSIQQNVTDTWWKLADDLIVRYNDGYFNFGPYRPNAIGGIAFPTWFLRMIGYDDTFYRPGDHWVRPAGKDALEAAMANNTLAVTPINNVSTSSHGSWVGLLVGLAATVVVFGGGVVLGSRRERDRSLLKAEKDGYVRF
jgi:dipeptidase